jgi:hypothetical protein
METASTTLNSNDDEQELFVTNEKYNTLDQCIDDAQMQSDELFSIVNLVRGKKKNLSKTSLGLRSPTMLKRSLRKS